MMLLQSYELMKEVESVEPVPEDVDDEDGSELVVAAALEVAFAELDGTPLDGSVAVEAAVIRVSE